MAIDTGSPPAPAAPPLTAPAQLAAALPGAPVVVAKASGSDLTPGETVAAVTAPPKGPIPSTEAGVKPAAVVVAVKPWWQSETIIVGAGAAVFAVVDGTLNVFFPAIIDIVTGSETLTALKVKQVAIRSAVVGVYGAWTAWKRKRDNTVVG